MLKPLIIEESEQDSKLAKSTPPLKAHIADELEAEANAPREKKFQLPSGQVLLLTYLIDKYGDDFKVRITFKILNCVITTLSLFLFFSFGPYREILLHSSEID